MGMYVGLDLGSSTLSGVLIDTQAQRVVARHTVPNRAEITSASDRARGWSEWSIESMAEAALALIASVAEGSPVDAVGVTGQQHGMVLLDAAGAPCSPFIGWQDERCNEVLPDGRTTIQRVLQRGGHHFFRSGCPPATGYMASTLFWLRLHHLLPAEVTACFAPDYLVARLCGQAPVTDPTLAASSGVFDVPAGQWNLELLEALGLTSETLPPVVPSCTLAGAVGESAARAAGLQVGTPVAVGCGDNQASFAGSVADPGRSVLVNIGTGGQTSVFVEQPLLSDQLDLRPFLQEGFLLVGAGLAGGRSYRLLRDFMGEVGRSLFGVEPPADLYDRLTALARQTPPGSEGVTCDPTFAGTRRAPDRRAAWRGLSSSNFRPGNLARSLLEGLASQYHRLYEDMLELGAWPRERLIGAGNGLRENPLLAEIVAEAFQLPMQSPLETEEAAVGAALTAAVAVGEFPDIKAAGRAFILYRGAC